MPCRGSSVLCSLHVLETRDKIKRRTSTLPAPLVPAPKFLAAPHYLVFCFEASYQVLLVLKLEL